MILDNISIKVVLNNEYKTRPYFSLEQAQTVLDSLDKESNAQIYRIFPEKTDIPDVLLQHNAYFVITEEKGQKFAYDNEGGFFISQETINNSLIEV